MYNIFRFTTLIFIVTSLLACATQLAKPINEAIENNPDLGQVRVNVEAYQGKRVRWGGVIASVHNEANQTVIEIVSRPLDSRGKPVDTDRSAGRFVARVKGFLDPVVYAPGRKITVVGSILGAEKRKIDAYEYQYVVVRVDSFKLWAVEQARPQPVYDPFWYCPWYPYYPWPYYH